MADMDDKMGYAFDRMVDYMGRGSVLGLRSTGYIEDMDNINAYTLVETYKDVIQNDDKHVYVVGDIDESIVSIFEERFSSHVQFMSLILLLIFIRMSVFIF